MSEPPSGTPTAPKLKSTDLPDVEVDAIFNPAINNSNADLAPLSPQLFESSATEGEPLNPNFLDDIIPDRPLISEIAPMSTLREEYERGARSFVDQIDWLIDQGYRDIRRTKGDGDCFYRSVAFAYVERLMHAPDLDMAVAGGLSILSSTVPMLEKVGFQPIVFEDFYEVLTSLVENIVKPDTDGHKLTPQSLLEKFQSPEVSTSIVVYFRLLTSAHIRLNPESFSGFLIHPELGEPMEIKGFCENFVEALGKEADHVQMTALSEALKINIDVAYLDGRGPSNVVSFVQFQNATDEATKPLILLYRPGHYDILLEPVKDPRQ